MATRKQTVAGAGQFTGSPGAGLFALGHYNQIPLTTRICALRLSYHAAAGGAPGDEVSFYFRDPDLGDLILIGRALAVSITGPDGSGDYVVSPGVVPRDFSGTNWDIVCFSVGKTVDAYVILDYQVIPFAHVSREDSIL
jgi:hypothetical protein